MINTELRIIAVKKKLEDNYMSSFIDLLTGRLGQSISDDTGITDDGNLVTKVGDDMVMNQRTGEVHITSGWPKEDHSGFSVGNPFGDDNQ